MPKNTPLTNGPYSKMKLVTVKYASEAVAIYCASRFRFEYISEKTSGGMLRTHTAVGFQEGRTADVEQSIYGIIRAAFERWRSEELAICFDGGKDGHVVLDMVKRYVEESGIVLTKNILVFNIIPIDSEIFTETLDLVRTSVATAPAIFKLREHKAVDIRTALAHLKTDCPTVKAIFMGVRRTDGPWFKNSSSFQITDDGWPDYMRIYPILDWSYADVWAYLEERKICYCKLYDEGYTSLGPKSKCGRNPELRVTVDFGGERPEINCYLPAKCLPSAVLERYKR